MKRSLDTSPLKPDSNHPYTLPRAGTEAGTCGGHVNSASMSLFGDWEKESFRVHCEGWLDC